MIKTVLTAILLKLHFALNSFNPGVQLGNWVKEQAEGLAYGIIAGVSLYFLLRRRLTDAVNYLIIVVVVGVLIFLGPEIRVWLTGMVRSIFGF